MICPVCKKEISDNLRYCNYCQSRIIKSEVDNSEKRVVKSEDPKPVVKSIDVEDGIDIREPDRKTNTTESVVHETIAVPKVIIENKRVHAPRVKKVRTLPNIRWIILRVLAILMACGYIAVGFYKNQTILDTTSAVSYGLIMVMSLVVLMVFGNRITDGIAILGFSSPIAITVYNLICGLGLASEAILNSLVGSFAYLVVIIALCILVNNRRSNIRDLIIAFVPLCFLLGITIYEYLHISGTGIIASYVTCSCIQMLFYIASGILAAVAINHKRNRV